MKKASLCFCLLFVFTLQLQAEPVDTRDAFAQFQSAVRMVKLENGLRVLFYRRDVAPVFSGTVAVRVGGSDEQVGQTGIAHMLEHMAFKGTPEIGTKDFAREQELLAELETVERRALPDGSLTKDDQEQFNELRRQLEGVWITNAFTREYEERGASNMNATTDSDLTRYFVDLPRASFEFWCKMEAARIAQPVMRQFYQERDVVLEERRMRVDDDPEGKMYDLLLSTAFRVHPYRNPVIGYPFDLKRLTATELTDFHKTYYSPSNIVVALVGDVNAEADLSIVQRYFGRIPAGAPPPRPRAVEPVQKGERTATLREQAAPQMIVAYHKPNYPHPDDPPISVATEILASGQTSRLIRSLVTQKRLAASIAQDEGPGAAYPNLTMFWIRPAGTASYEKVLSDFDAEISRLASEGPTAEELDRTKRELAVEYLRGFQSNSALGIHLATSELLYDDWKAAFTWLEQAMAVSADDVKQMVAKYLTHDNRTVVTLMPAAQPENARRQK